jgi:hypothetical protein
MSRTTPEAVRSLVDMKPGIDPQFYIDQAGVVTDMVAAADSTLADNRLTLIESLLAAHYYTLKDQRLKSRTVGQASSTFVETSFWDEAKKLDPTGTLSNMENGLEVDIVWLGKPDSERSDWRLRN